MTERHQIACFMRIDLDVPGGPSPELYEMLSERISTVFEQALLADPAGSELLGLSAFVLGPLTEEDLETLENGVSIEEQFAPLLEVIDDQAEED